MTFFVGLCALLPAQVPEPGATTFGAVDLRCGGYCVYVALKGQNISVPSYQEFEKRLGQPDWAGYSMQQLCEVAKSYGAFAVPVETDLMILEQLEEPFACVALMGSRHFVTIVEINEAEVRLLDPPESYNMRRGLFEQLWTGKALLISTTNALSRR